MKISGTDNQYVLMKVAQFKETAIFAEDMDVSAASNETVRSILTDLVRIVRDYVADLENIAVSNVEKA